MKPVLNPSKKFPSMEILIESLALPPSIESSRPRVGEAPPIAAVICSAAFVVGVIVSAPEVRLTVTIEGRVAVTCVATVAVDTSVVEVMGSKRVLPREASVYWKAKGPTPVPAGSKVETKASA
jgi:hypothetical protein